MPVNPEIQPASLVVSSQDISPTERQNRFGMRHCAIPELPPGKHLTVLAILTPTAFSSAQFFEVLDYLRRSYDVESMQTAFAAVIPDYGAGVRNNLFLSAHLRADISEPEA